MEDEKDGLETRGERLAVRGLLRETCCERLAVRDLL